MVGDRLIRRLRVELFVGANDIDTGLTQTNVGMTDATLAARTMIIVLPPTSNWSLVVPQDPFVDAVTRTVHVVLTASVPTTVNVLFWVPHTMVGPVSTSSYLIP